MKNKKIFPVVIVLMVLSFCIGSCNDVIEPDIKECPDSRFIGKWERLNTSSVDYYMMYSFSDSNKILWGSINYLREEYGFSQKKPLEWKKEGDRYYKRHWDANDSWQPFNLQYIDENHIIIDGDTYTKTTTNLLSSGTSIPAMVILS